MPRASPLLDKRVTSALPTHRSPPPRVKMAVMTLKVTAPHGPGAGYVLVRDHGHRVCGLITASDLTVQFGTRVRPFVLVEEIEQRLRRVVDRCIPLDRIKAAVPRGRAAQVNSAANLTFGAYGHLLKTPENWAAIGWAIDQQHFLSARPSAEARRWAEGRRCGRSRHPRGPTAGARPAGVDGGRAPAPGVRRAAPPCPPRHGPRCGGQGAGPTGRCHSPSSTHCRSRGSRRSCASSS